MPIFERTEYLSRIAKTKQRMEAAGIELLLISEPANMYYLSGFAVSAFYDYQFVALALDDEEPLWIGEAWTDSGAARQTTFMDDSRVLTYDGPRMEFLAHLITDRGWDRRTIGMEYETRSLPHGVAVRLQRLLPNATFRDATGLVDWVRTIKSSQEIAYMREAGVLADHAMRTGIAAVREGVRECDAAGKIFAALVGGTAEYGGHYPEGLALTTGVRLASPHSLWTEEPFQVGAITHIELGGCRHAYNAGLTRTIAVGNPSDSISSLLSAVSEGLAAVLEAARPGVTCEEADAVYQRAISRHSEERSGGIGYSIGIGFPGWSWTERSIDLRHGERFELQPNMTFHLIPVMWIEQGVRSPVMSETFRVTESGPAESFSNLERQLFVSA